MRVIRFMIQSLVCLSFCILSSCIGKAVSKVLPQRGYKAEEVEKIKRVAIVAFDVLQYQPTGVASKVVGSVSTVQTVQNMEPMESPLSTEMYHYLEDQLKTQRKWHVISQQDVMSNPVYKKLYEEKKTKLQSKISANHFQRSLHVKGILRPVNPEYLLTADEVQQLRQALKVDGLVMAQIAFSTKQNDFTGLGIANIYLMSFFRFHLFEAGTNQKIWFDQGFEGPIPDESLGKVSGLEDASKIEKLARPLARQTIDQFFSSATK